MGDVYYKTKYSKHNLIRAKNQNKLLEYMEKDYSNMAFEIQNLINQ